MLLELGEAGLADLRAGLAGLWKRWEHTSSRSASAILERGGGLVDGIVLRWAWTDSVRGALEEVLLFKWLLPCLVLR